MTYATYDRHHLYWPAKDYTDPLEKQFRNLSCHVIKIATAYHRIIHQTMPAPPKPSIHYMREIILLHVERRCPVCHETEIRAQVRRLRVVGE